MVVISDQAHRSQYGTKGRLDTKTGKYVYGYAKHMPGASFIGFTGTPIKKADANTQETFGSYVSIYDIEGAKERVEEIAADLVATTRRGRACLKARR